MGSVFTFQNLRCGSFQLSSLLLVLTDSVHSNAYSGTMSINFCHTAAVSGTMKLVSHIFSRSKFSMEHQFHYKVPLTLAVWHMSIDLVPLLAAEWTESDKHIKLIGLMTITMKKNTLTKPKENPGRNQLTGSPHHVQLDFYRQTLD